MTFTIVRASSWDRNKKPCEEAIQLNDEWVISFDTLEELMLFVGKYKQLVLTEDRVEIYDDYRE